MLRTNGYQGFGSWTNSYLLKRPSHINGYNDYNTKERALNLVHERLNLNDYTKIKMIEMKQELNTYLFGLDKIKDNFDLAGSSFHHTTVLNEDKSIDLHSINEGNATFLSRSLNNAVFETVYKSIEPKRKDDEIRICKIPAINVEALWVHSESNADYDEFFPIYQFGIGNNETIQKKYSKRDFVKLVQQLAERVQPTDDNLLGS